MRDSLPPPILVADEDSLGRLVRALTSHPVVAVDTESNSLHAYRERVCLIQFSTPAADYIVDPIKLRDLSALAPFFANPDQQKVFHAAEYDLICLRRDYGFAVTNIFDTMSAARTLGWPQVGLAAILDTHFGVTLDKKYQRADWKRRPLTPEQLDYARLDTHYLVALRDRQLQALTESGHWPEAQEEFERLALPRGDSDGADSAPAFWRVKGARDLTPPQAAILQALFAYREQQAERLDCPPFRVMGEAVLLELARRAPRQDRRPAGPARHDARANPPPRARRVGRDPTGTPLSGPARTSDRSRGRRRAGSVRSASHLAQGQGEGARRRVGCHPSAHGALGSRPASTAHARRAGAHRRLRPLAAGDLRGGDSEAARSRRPFAGSHLTWLPLREDPRRDVADDLLRDMARDLVLGGRARSGAGDEQMVERRDSCGT